MIEVCSTSRSGQIKIREIKMKLLFLIGLLIAISFAPVNATNLSTDRASYQNGDVVFLTGSVSQIEEGQLITVQILNPSKSDFAQIDAFAPNSDGTFSRSYKAEGPKWNMDGTYTLKLFYNQESFGTTFEFGINPPSVQESVAPESKPEQGSKPMPKQEQEPEYDKRVVPSVIITKQEYKSHILGFPALDKSPQHYFDRYDNEDSYKDWFDSEFPYKSIQDVVGYTITHVSGFPDDSKSPQHYIDRYNNESDYKDWFDSEFTDQSIYEILGFAEPASVPEWIKNNAGWWAAGKIVDDEFVSGLQFMIENDIITITDLPEYKTTSEKMPRWIRSNAGWWALDKISEKEFVNGIKYLIINGIIKVDR